MEDVLARLDHPLTISDCVALFSEDASAHIEELAQASHKLTLERFGRTIKLYAPLYISNECINSCLYCGFNHNNKVERRTLTLDEIQQEADYLISKGHRQILLVAGEDTSALPLKYFEEIVKSLRSKFSSIIIEVRPFDEIGYKELAAAGVDGVTLYQETYDPVIYSIVHPRGPKSIYNSRLKAIDDAGKAGMRFLGMGTLLGLAPWRREALSLVAHARWLIKHHWQSTVSVSLPRIRSSASNFKMPYSVTDRDLTQLVCVLRLALPDSNIVLSTRENARLRNNLIPLGVTQISAGSATSPGGYSLGEKCEKQFEMEDRRDTSEIAEMLKERGYDPVFKDWDLRLSKSERII